MNNLIKYIKETVYDFFINRLGYDSDEVGQYSSIEQSDDMIHIYAEIEYDEIVRLADYLNESLHTFNRNQYYDKMLEFPYADFASSTHLVINTTTVSEMDQKIDEACNEFINLVMAEFKKYNHYDMPVAYIEGAYGPEGVGIWAYDNHRIYGTHADIQISEEELLSSTPQELFEKYKDEALKELEQNYKEVIDW